MALVISVKEEATSKARGTWKFKEQGRGEKEFSRSVRDSDRVHWRNATRLSGSINGLSEMENGQRV